ncbi:MAG: RIP metalloprotease RseP, partial [bacterium]
ERFSIGYPPKMFGFRRGETEYCVSWIPLGGYVKMSGMEPGEEPGDPDDPRMFGNHPPLQRAGIIMAGPLMNLLLAFILMPMVFMIGMNLPRFMDEKVEVGWIVPDSPADRAGLLKSDIVMSVNDKEIGTWGEFFESTASMYDGDTSIGVMRNGKEVSLSLDVEQLKAGETLGFMPPMEPVVGSLAPGFPAKDAGMQKGDRVISVGGLPVGDWNEMARIIHSSPGKPITIQVHRDGKTIALEVIPRQDPKSGRGLVGISPENETVVRKYPFAEAVIKGFERNVQLLGLTFGFIVDLLTFKASIKMLGGPIMIFQVTGEAARTGLAEFIAFMAFLSLQLGILNLFPIPVLDGGHIVFLGIEGIIGRPLEPRYREMAQRVGFLLLILLILIVSYNDIARVLSQR